jgi:hypothetical protein
MLSSSYLNFIKWLSGTLPKFHEDVKGCIQHKIDNEDGKKKASKIPTLLGQNDDLKNIMKISITSTVYNGPVHT